MSRLESRPSSATTIERTSKSLKGHTLLGMLLLIIGIVWWIVAGSRVSAGIGMMTTFVGLVWYFVARAATWWHHG